MEDSLEEARIQKLEVRSQKQEGAIFFFQSSSGLTRRSMPLHNALKMDAGSSPA